MSYHKFMKKVAIKQARLGTAENNHEQFSDFFAKTRNYLQSMYQGPSNRVERYSIYDGMETDPVIGTALDIISEYVALSGDEPFHIEYSSQTELPETHTSSIEKLLDKWISLNNWNKRLYGTVRDVLKYGDVIFIRDPETNALNKCNIYDVLGVICDENKIPQNYIIRNIDLNIPLQVANDATNDVTTRNMLSTLNSNLLSTTTGTTTSTSNSYINGQQDGVMQQLPVSAEHVIHLSSNIDNILIYPFGLSALEKIYKTYVQKMMLQDCIILNRIQNAVEKKVFTIPVGNIPRHKRMQYMEKCKNEYSQRRLPSKNSDGIFNTVDVAYDTLSMSEDFWIPVDSNGIQPKIEKLQAGSPLGEIKDINYWEMLLVRGLNVPQSWVALGTDDSQRNIPTNMANTFVQEQRFFQYCKRIQSILIEVFDKEFKLYLKKNGINVEEDAFKLAFYKPSSITELTNIEMQKNRLDLCSSAMQNPYISKQFALKHYLNLTEEEYNENERLLMLEMQNILKDKEVKLPVENKNAVPGLRSVNISDIPQDYYNQTKEDLSSGLGGGDMGGLGGDLGGDLGGAPDMGGAPAPSGEGGGIENAMSQGFDLSPQ